MSDKQLLTSQRYVNAKNIPLFINAELSGEQNILIPEKANNVFDFSLKFEQERNSSSKFCIYGLVESKWGDCENRLLEFKIGDSSTNLIKNPNSYFWFYDRTSNMSGYSWSIFSKGLASGNDNLSKNIYGKNKGQYFFPFELDIDNLTKTNKSIFVKLSDPIKNLYAEEEFPFLYFDDEGNLIEYGTETAEILDDGNILEINNNYPFFYDRHWLRRQVEPTGPPFVYFTEEQITYDEGGNNPRQSEDKFVEVGVELSQPPHGIEKVKIDVIYGLDENLNEYTTVTIPQDIAINFGTLEWNSASASTLQKIRVKILDDFFVERTERLTLKLTPIIGLLADPEKAQTCSIYIVDNDIPSRIAFEGQSFQFTEPREDSIVYSIPIKLKLDQTLLVPDQSVEVYIDRNSSDCISTYGFIDSSSTGYTEFKKINLNMTDLEYSVDLFFVSKRVDDIRRKIVLKLRNFTSNVILQSFNQGLSIDYTIYVDKNNDKKFVQINIPYDPNNGIAVLRSVYNLPLSRYDYEISLSTYYQSTIGNITPNSLVSGYTNASLLRCMVFEPFFQLELINKGRRVVFDNHAYDTDQKIVVNVYSGSSTSVSSNDFTYDGTKFILKLPANVNFVSSHDAIFNASQHNPLLHGLGSILGAGSSSSSGATTNGGTGSGNTVWGYKSCYYEIYIKNNSYNYIPNTDISSSSFIESNIITTPIKLGNFVLSSMTYEYNYQFASSAGDGVIRNVSYDLYTELISCSSQIQWDPDDPNVVTSYSSTTLQYTKNKLYYKGAIILPKPEIEEFVYSAIAGQNPPTSSVIFLTQDKIINENNFISGSTTNINVKNFPVTDYLIKEPYDQYQKSIRVNFGQLLVQAGYSQKTAPTNGWSTEIVDSFTMATINLSNRYPSANDKNTFLYDWNGANVSTKNGACIEILNDGEIPTTILGVRLQPQEKLWISEAPIRLTTLNGTPLYQGVYNVVQPINRLVLDLPTNHKFERSQKVSVNRNIYTQTLNVFMQSKYKISFLNFVLYNSNGSPANKTVNLTKNFNQRIKTAGSSQVIFLPTQLFLHSKYSRKTFIPVDFSYGTHRGQYLCLQGTVLNLCISNNTDSNNFNRYGNYLKVQGLIISASNSSYLAAIDFDEEPYVVNWTNDWCGAYGFYWKRSD